MVVGTTAVVGTVGVTGVTGVAGVTGVTGAGGVTAATGALVPVALGGCELTTDVGIIPPPLLRLRARP